MPYPQDRSFRRVTRTRAAVCAVVLALGILGGIGCSGHGGGDDVEIQGGDAGMGDDGGSSTQCPDGERACGGDCVDPMTADEHCGACGNACRTETSTGQCRQGSCTNWTCQSGHVDTDGDPANGCERSCSGQSLSSDGVLDGNLKVVDVQGTVEQVGDLPKMYSNWSGTLVFRRKATGEAFTVGLEASAGESVSYSIRLYEGTYDVEFQPGTGCGEQAGGPHCETQTLHDAIDLTSDGTLDGDVRVEPSGSGSDASTFDIAGTVTKNGSAIDGGGDAVGQVQFVAESGFTQSAPIESDGSYEISVVEGTYEIRVVNSESCGDSPTLPCLTRVVKEEIAIRDGGSLDLDVSVIEVVGTVTANGDRIPDASDGSDRGTLSFANDESATSVSLGSSGAATYEVLLYPGTAYQMTLSRSGCAGDSDPVLPCMNHQIAEKQTFNASGEFGIDVQTVTVSGAVTVGGQTPKKSETGKSRGTLTFRGAGGSRAFDLGKDGSADFEGQLYAGDYDVVLTNQSDCPGDAEQALPCQSTVLRNQIGITNSGSLDLNVKPVTIQGEVTIGGSSLSGADGPRGSVVFTETAESGGTVTAALEQDGSATYKALLYPGEYDVALTNTACKTDQLPCQRVVVQKQASLTADGVLDHDLQVVEIKGEVTVEGNQMGKPEAGRRGDVRFVQVGDSAPDEDAPGRTVAVESSGPATYDARVVTGTYVIEFDGKDCPKKPDKAGIVPCGTDVLIGCSQ